MCYRRRKQRRKESINGRIHKLYDGAKNRAKEKGLPFTITYDELLQKMIDCDGFCPVTGDAFDLTTGIGRSGYRPSIDQIKPGVGYTKENVQIVVWWYNAAKGDWFTDEEARSKFYREKPEGSVNSLPLEPRRIRHVNKTGFKGVYQNRFGRFSASLWDGSQRQQVYLGLYNTADEAAQAITAYKDGTYEKTYSKPTRAKQHGSQYRWVYWSKIKRVWRVEITRNSIRHRGGAFKSELEAAHQADRLALSLGISDRLNFPEVAVVAACT